jgi:hypothetical protein
LSKPLPATRPPRTGQDAAAVRRRADKRRGNGGTNCRVLVKQIVWLLRGLSAEIGNGPIERACHPLPALFGMTADDTASSKSLCGLSPEP